MKEFFRTLSLAPRSIRHKLTVAFALMSVIPMLVCGYLVIYYIFPTLKSFWDVSLILLISLFLMGLGFYLAQKIIYPIIEITAHAKVIAGGKELSKELKIDAEDEIGELSGSLNQLSARLKKNMSELHSYGEKIKQINMEINKKVFALSSLLQIGNLITTASDITEVLSLITQKLSQVESGGAAFMMLLDEASGELTMRSQVNLESEKAIKIKVKMGQGLLGEVMESNYPLVIDFQKRPKFVDQDLEEILPAKNIAVVPITTYGKIVGILGTGNNAENFLFTDDEIELIKVFSKQAGVALENDTLVRKTEELSLTDELTGLFNDSYIRGRLDEEIKRSITYQRPCSFAVLDVDNFEQYRGAHGELAAEKALKKIAQTLKDSISDVDKAARFTDHQFAVVLPEKNKRDSMKVAENIRKAIENLDWGQKKDEALAVLGISGGISASPVDGTTSVELINQSLEYLVQAKQEGQNKVVAS